MAASISVVTDRVILTTRSMVYSAMRALPLQCATVNDLVDYLNQGSRPEQQRVDAELVERVLEDMRLDGVVARQQGRWFLARAVA